LKALVIRQPWIGMILRGSKDWEMRKQRCTHRGPIALIEQGTGTVVGTARIVDDLPPLTEAEMLAREDRHGISAPLIPEVIARGWVRPWVLVDIQRLPRPVPYDHPSGAVGWVNLSPEVEALVAGRTAASSPVEYDDAPSNKMLKLGPNRTSQIFIDIAIEDGEWTASPKVQTSGWIELTGTLAALAAMICFFGFIVHLLVGLNSASVSAFAAFRWWFPMIISMVIAVLFGQGDLLDEAFGRR
jgi:hypothetical protein